MEFKCKCGEVYESNEVYEEVGDVESGPMVEVVDMTVWECPKCGESIREAKDIEQG